MKVLIHDLGSNVLRSVFATKPPTKMSLSLAVTRLFLTLVPVFHRDAFHLDYLSEIVQLLEVLENRSVSDSLFAMPNVDQE